jgi:serine protease Do
MMRPGVHSTGVHAIGVCILTVVAGITGAVGPGGRGLADRAWVSLGPAVAPAQAESLEAYPRAGAESWLGVRVQEFDPALREAFDYEGSGIIVAGVSPGSPAERAGLRQGDVITHVDGAEMRTNEDLALRVHGHQPGDVLALRVRRGGQEEAVAVTLEAGPKSPSISGLPWRTTSYLGARVEALSPDLASYFGAEPGTGVLVLAVAEGAPAANAGLKPGDVLTQLDHAPIHSPADLAAVLRGRAPRARVVATVVRHGRETEIAVVLGESSSLDQLLDQIHVDREDIDSLLGDLRQRMSGGQGHMSSGVKQLEAMIRDMQRKVDELVDRALK